MSEASKQKAVLDALTALPDIEVLALAAYGECGNPARLVRVAEAEAARRGLPLAPRAKRQRLQGDGHE